jgi:dephospho-CoA kinase
VTGNIACGKSTVDAMLREIAGATIIDADRVTHQVLEQDDIRGRVLAAFGAGVLTAEGHIDRASLGRMVFANPADLGRLEGIVHPAVRRAVRAELGTVPAAGMAVIDAVKLLDGDLGSLADGVWWVTATPEQQLARLVTSRGLSENQARARLAAQPRLERYRDRIHAIIDNSGHVAETRIQVVQALGALRANPSPQARPIAGSEK